MASVEDKVNLFAYGVFKDPAMFEALVGHIPEGGSPAVLEDHELVVQKGSEIPQQVIDIIKNTWTQEELDSFITYAVREKIGGYVIGKVWSVTQDDLRAINDWELAGLWYKQIDGTAVNSSHGAINVVTHGIDEPALQQATEHETHLMDRDRILSVARQVRAMREGKDHD